MGSGGVKKNLKGLQDFYPIIVTDKLFECRDFYAKWLGMQVGFQSSWFVWLQSAESDLGGRANLAFMHPSHPSSPPGPEAFDGNGVLLTFQVANARQSYEAFVAGGAHIAYALHDEPFGQRRFGLHDPSGTWVDVVEQIEPAAGWWDQYLI
jgi:catechol 2,3-dioxygenase-like lactoylglutathione lyase family enzyme